MKKISKGNRHRSHQRGKKFVDKYRGLVFNPIFTYNTEVVIPGKYAQVDVTLNLGSHPLPELTDVTPLEQMMANMESRRRVRVRTAPAPVAPIASGPVLEKRSRRKTVVALIAAGLGAIGIGYALYRKAV
jgi:hypothetical protein